MLLGARRPGFPTATGPHALVLAEGWWHAAASTRHAAAVGRDLHDLRNALSLTIAARRLATQDRENAVIDRVTYVSRHLGYAVARVTRVEDLVLAAEPTGAQPPAACNAEPLRGHERA